MNRVHYGWIIAIVCMLLILGTALISSAIAINLNALRSFYGFSGTETSLIITVMTATALIVALFSDRYFEKLGLRYGVTLAAISGMMAFITYGSAGSNIFIYYAGSVFGGITYALGMILPASLLMRRWFNKSRGLALSLASAGTGLSTAIGAPLIQSIINGAGISMSFYSEAIYFAVIAVLCFVVIRNDPADLGLEPYGGNDYVGTAESKRVTGYCVGGLALFALAILAVLAGAGGSPSTSNIALNFSTEGMNTSSIALGFSIYGILLMFSKIIFGKVVDSKGACTATVIFGSLVATGLFCCFIIGTITNEYLMFLTFIFLGLGYPITTLGYPNWAAELVPKDSYPKVMKRFQIAFQFGALLGSPIPGIIADATGHYTGAYLLFSLFFITMVIAIVLIYRSAGKKASAVST